MPKLPAGGEPNRKLIGASPEGLTEAQPDLVPLDLRAALDVFRRRKWLVMGIIALAVPLAILVWATSARLYEAKTVIRLADTRGAVTGGLVSPQPAVIGRSVDPLLTEAGVITSRAMIGEVVDKTPFLRVATSGFPVSVMQDDVEFGSADLPDSITLQFASTEFIARVGDEEVRGAYGARVDVQGVAFSLGGPPDAESGTLYVVSREAAISSLRGGLTAEPREHTDIIDLAYVDPDRSRALFFVNLAAQTYQAANMRDARQQAQVQREFLEAQIEISDSLLEEAQRALTGFRATAGTYRRQAAPGNLAELGIRREEAKTELERYEMLRARVQRESGQAQREALRAAMTLSGVSASGEAAALDRQLVAQETALDSLLIIRPATSPDVGQARGLIATTQARLARAVESALRAAIASSRARIATLDGFRAQTDANLRQASETGAQESWLDKQVETASDISKGLREQLQRAQLAERLEVGQVQILDPAVAAVPVGVGTTQKIALIFVLALMLGTGAAFTAEHFNSSIRSQKEISALGLPVLGVVPRLKHGDGGALKKASSPVIEALRGVRLNLVYAHGTAGSLTATITSACQGDGKSFVASNLALAFAYAGHQTLLIDGDVRRGASHHLLGRHRKPGLTDLLVGRAPRDQVIQKTQFPRLHYIASGTRTSQAPEFLGSPAMAQLIVSLRASYGVILVDSPPLGAGVDALSLGAVTGNMLLVLRGGVTDRAAIEAKLDLVERLPIRVLGCIVNAVRAEDGEQYSSYYMEGYELEDEEEPARKIVHRGHGHQLSGGRRRRG
jgi:capsular exopolysaccharide synthesis family protein